MEVIFGNEFLDGKVLDKKEITLVLFAGLKYPPCEEFVARLASIYNEENRYGKVFEVIFVSLDGKLEDFLNGCREMPWLIIPFNKKQRIKRIVEKYEVNYAPCLILIDQNGDLILKNCKNDVDRLGKHAVEFWVVFLNKQLARKLA